MAEEGLFRSAQHRKANHFVAVFVWLLVLANLLPILWMAWVSFMGSGEILDGKLIPRPRANAVVYATDVGKNDVLVGTVDGQVVRLSGNSFVMRTQIRRNLGTFANSYDMKQGVLWNFSSTGGLVSMDSETLAKKNHLSPADLARRYKKYDPSLFRLGPDFRDSLRRAELVAMLNGRSSEESDFDLSSFLGKKFHEDSTVVDELNAFLEDQTAVKRLLTEVLPKGNWANPVIHRMAGEKRSDRENKILTRYLLAELIKHPLLYMEEVRWKDLWITRIPKTSLAHNEDKFFFSVWWNGFPGIGIYEEATDRLSWITPQGGLPSRSIQHLKLLKDGRLLALTDEGVSLIDPQREVVVRNYPFGKNGLRYADGRRVQVAEFGSQGCILSFSEELVYLDYATGQGRLFEQGFLRRISSEITAVQVEGNLLFAGTGQGLFSLDLTLVDSLRRAGSLSSTDKISVAGSEMKIYNGIFIEKMGGIAAVDRVIDFISTSDSEVLVGGLDGHFSLLSLDSRRIKGFFRFPTGGSYFHWRNYVDLWKTIPFGTFLWNSLVICFSVMFLTMILSTLSAYAISRYRFPGRELFGQSVLVTQMVPGVLFLIPIFIFFSTILRYTGIPMVNTYHGIILTYTAFFTPMAIWFLRGFFARIPRELEESALMDGCSSIGAFVKIIIPVALPSIFATGIFIFLLAWDELLFAWVLCTDIETATIPVGIRLYVGQLGNRFDLLMAASTVATLPVIFLFLVMQKQIVSGLTGGKVKG